MSLLAVIPCVLFYCIAIFFLCVLMADHIYTSARIIIGRFVNGGMDNEVSLLYNLEMEGTDYILSKDAVVELARS